ncbi:MAG TPA: hypothetical protein VHO71_02485 [Caproiciproducens sp.]|nr:hypothetical protein [Caproiciproducens sp.]
MLHVRDYQSLNSLIEKNDRKKPDLVFQSLTGRIITVYVDNAKGSFTGLLLESAPEWIRLILDIPSAPAGDRAFCRNRGVKTGTECVIMKKHISAVAYRFI